MQKSEIKAAGGCLCGAVRYEVHGELLQVINCHCSKCRRFHGHVGAYTATRRENLILVKPDGLKWYRSVLDETPDVYRGFCRECGSSLFWDPRGKQNISIAAGSLDPPTTLSTERHVWLSQKPDYYALTDNLPQHAERYDRSNNEHGGTNS
jgi:hypothetical protein